MCSVRCKDWVDFWKKNLCLLHSWNSHSTESPCGDAIEFHFWLRKITIRKTKTSATCTRMNLQNIPLLHLDTQGRVVAGTRPHPGSANRKQKLHNFACKRYWLLPGCVGFGFREGQEEVGGGGWWRGCTSYQAEYTLVTWRPQHGAHRYSSKMRGFIPPRLSHSHDESLWRNVNWAFC